MTDHSSLLKEKNNFDIVERLATDVLWLRRRAIAVIPDDVKEAAAEITRLREDNKKLSDKVEALRKDAARWRFTNENWFQFFEPTQHWKVTTATGKVLHEGLARTYEAAVDAAIAATTESETKEQQA